jgi:hypothetical protein
MSWRPDYVVSFLSMSDRFTPDRVGSTGQVVNEETMSILITSPDSRIENVLGIGPARTKIAQRPPSSDRIKRNTRPCALKAWRFGLEHWSHPRIGLIPIQTSPFLACVFNALVYIPAASARSWGDPYAIYIDILAESNPEPF